MMFSLYLKVALRNLLGNRLYSFINIFGLAIGLTSVILLGLYVQYELSYDEHYTGSDRLYRVSRDIFREGMQDVRLATAPPIMAELLRQDFPEIETTTRMYALRALVGRDELAFYEDRVRYVDPNFFTMFDVQWLQGSADALLEQTSVVLTRSKAQRYFGNEDPIGQTLLIENRATVTVRGVIADLPQNTHLSGDFFVPLENYLRIFPDDVRNGWNANLVFTYARLAPGADIEAIAARFPDFLNRHVATDASSWTALVPLKITDIHLRSPLPVELQPGGSFATVLTLITVAAAILLIACFNFMNLATARSMLRSKEVGVRKTIGSDRWQLIAQFLVESVGITLIATLFAVVLVELVLPAFIAFTGRDLTFDPLSDHDMQVMLVSLVLIVGVIAGSYPAFYLASFKPALVLRSKAGTSMADVLLRNLLVILQFAISITLVVATAVVFLQTRYARDFDPGFNKEQVVLLGGPPSQGLTDRWQTLKDELLRSPGVTNVTASNLPPGRVNLNNVEVTTEGGTQGLNMPPMMVDYDFFETYDIALLSGRVFSADFGADALTPPAVEGGSATGNLVLNASAARQLGWDVESALGKQLEFQLFPGTPRITGRVVGVVADSNFESIRSSLKPVLFIAVPSGFVQGIPVLNSAAVRISASDASTTLATIDATWKRVIPEFPVTRAFLSDNFDALYQNDTRLAQMYSSFATLAILIACLGLYGLATFNTQRRIKEIGIRKVMGGSVWSIVLLLTNDFSKLVLIANVIAWPAAYFAMQRWLENFAYRIDLTPLVFIGSGLIALCVAWVTVGGTAAKAANARPVLALRYE